MAKKKKTKVGKLISKAVGAVKNVVSSGTKKLQQAIDKSQVNKGGLLASASNALSSAGVGKSTQSKQTGTVSGGKGTISAPKKVSVLNNLPSPKSKSSSGASSNYPGLTGNVPTGITFGGKGTNLSTFSSGGLTLSKASAPTDATSILEASETPSFDMSSGESFNAGAQTGTTSSKGMGIASIAGANAAAAGAEEANNLAIEQKKSAEQLALDQAAKEQEGNQSFLKKIFKEQEKAPTREELREDYEQEFNIKARTAEINSLQQDLDKVLDEVANQEAVARDRLGTNNFINNQIAQIQRNASPVINRLSSEIKWKTGLLTEDRALMNEAISDALADSKARIDNMKWFYQENQQYLDKKYQQALTEKIRMEDRAYEEKQSFLEYARDIQEAYFRAGVNVTINPYTITPEELADKMRRNPIPQKSSDGASSRFTTSQVNNGAANAQLSIGEFESLPAELQNFFINTSDSIASSVPSLIADVNNGSLSIDDAMDLASPLPPLVQNYIKNNTSNATPIPKQTFWSKISNFFKG